MNKNSLKILSSSILALLFSLVSCDSQDDTTGNSTLIVADGVAATFAPDFDNSATIVVNEEDEETFTYQIVLNKAQAVDVHIHVSQIAGDAVEDEDFKMDHTIVIPANTTVGTGSIKILNDIYVEDTEMFTLQVGDIRTSNASFTPVNVSFEISNNLGTELDLAFNFGKDFYYQGGSLSLCGIGYDMDYYVLDSGYGDTGIYDAAASGCPAEHVTLSVDPSHPNYLADGIYYIYYDIYNDRGLSGAYHDVFDIPTTVEYNRVGGINPSVFNQEASFIPDSTFGSGSDYVVTIEVLNGTFSILNSLDEVQASGRVAFDKERATAAIQAARLRNANKM